MLRAEEVAFARKCVGGTLKVYLEAWLVDRRWDSFLPCAHALKGSLLGIINKQLAIHKGIFILQFF